MWTLITTLCSFALLAAHAFRAGSPGGAVFWLVAGWITIMPLPWKNWGLAGLLGFGVWLWGSSCHELVTMRIAYGMPWIRLASILAAVLLLCLLAAGMQLHRAVRNRSAQNFGQGLAFLLTVCGLSIARQKASMVILLADRFIPSSGWVVIILLGCYAAWVVGEILATQNSAVWRRRIWTIFSFFFFLQLIVGLTGVEQFLMTGKLHLPIPALIAAGPLYRGDGFFMIILFLVTIFLVGPAWCSHLCYIGVWDNWAASARRKAGALPGWVGIMRWLICFAVLAGAYLLGRSGFSPSRAALLAGGFGIIGIFIILSWSRKIGVMIHCTSYCPMGLLANILGKMNLWRIRIGTACCRCGTCSHVCRYNALTASDIVQKRAGFNCTLCGDCIAGCPHEQLHYHFPGLSRENGRTLFIAIVVALHAIFLGVARI